MNKQTKMIVGVGVLAVAAYLFHQQSQRMRNANGPRPRLKGCEYSPSWAQPITVAGIGGSAGYVAYECCDGSFGLKKGKPCEDYVPTKNTKQTAIHTTITQ